MKKPFAWFLPVALTLTLLLAACGGGGSGDPIIEGPQLPVARISAIPSNVVVNSLVQLDGRNSSDPQGAGLTYNWTLTRRPPTSTAALSSTTLSNPTLRPDVEGTYEIRLVVNNGVANSVPATASFVAFITPVPIADAGPALRTVGLGFPVALNASDSVSPTGAVLTYSWTLQSPAGSTAAIADNTAVATFFTPDVPGEYQVTLTANNGQATHQAQIRVQAIAAFFRTYGGSGDEFGRPVAELPDAYLLGGESDSPDISLSGSWDMAVLRTNLAGIQTDTSIFGGAGIDETWAMDVDAANNRLALAGYTESLDINGDAILVESDLDGNQIGAERIFGGAEVDLFQAVRYTADGGIILCGYSESPPFNPEGEGSAILVIKIAADGTVEFNEAAGYGGIGIEDCWAVAENQTGFLLAGFSNSTDAAGAAYLLEIDRLGTSVREATFGQQGVYDEFYDLKPTADGGYIAAGYTESFGDPLGDLYLVKVNADLSPAWELAVGGDDWDEAREAQQTSDGNYIAAGFSYSFGDGFDANAYLIKVNTDGTGVLWEQLYGMPGSSAEGWSIIQTSDGGFLMGGDIFLPGEEDLDWLLIKTDQDGKVPPVARSFAAVVATEGAAFSFNAGDNFDLVQRPRGSSPALSFSAIGLPQGISINPTTGVISGTLPTLTADTVYRITVIATDPEGLSAAETLTLTVRNVN